jgi:hypothetical protein
LSFFIVFIVIQVVAHDEDDVGPFGRGCPRPASYAQADAGQNGEDAHFLFP